MALTLGQTLNYSLTIQKIHTINNQCLAKPFEHLARMSCNRPEPPHTCA
jgi:hypothetical protein